MMQIQRGQKVQFGEFSGYLEEVGCPICVDAPEAKTIYTQKTGVSFKSCPQCELLYATPRFTEDSLLEIYENESFKDFSQYDHWDYESWKAQKPRSWVVSKLKSDLIKRFSSGKGRALDVGCATGEFCLEAMHNGINIEGIDISQKMNKIAREKLGIKATFTDIADFCPDYRFESLVIWDVLEHVFDPIGILDHCHRLLDHNGYLFAQVPNIHGLSNRFKSMRCRASLSSKDFSHFGFPYHLYFFGKKSLEHLLARAGFRVVEFESWSHLDKNGVDNMTARMLGKLTRKSCLSDYIIVVAQKI